MRKTNQQGFTIVELLVVVAIIGIISTLSMISFGKAREKTRDTRRKSDLVQIANAIRLYADNHEGVFPETGFGLSNNGDGFLNNRNSGSSCYPGGDLEDFLDGTDPDIPSPVKNYLKIPSDPKCGGCTGCNIATFGGYMYRSGSKPDCKVLNAHLENPSQEDLDSCNNNCGKGYSPSYGMNYCYVVAY